MEGDLIRINRWLMPLSWLYGVCTGMRNLLFDSGILKSRSYPIPIINVGNITVGGTGKTPHVEYLIRLLSDRYRVAVLSRGYRRKTRGYILATEDSTPRDIGDEPWQMKRKFPHIYMAVDGNRCRGIRHLLTDEATKDVEVILLDDAFQHRHVRPGLNILLTDYHRILTDDCLLPAGRLREDAAGRYRADLIVVTKCPDTLSPMEYRVLRNSLTPKSWQQLYFSRLNYSSSLQGVLSKKMLPLASLKNTNVLLVTGIGSPEQMERDMAPLTKCVRALAYPDHHNFTRDDITAIQTAYSTMEQPCIILTTEKDAARFQHMGDEVKALRDKFYFLPIEIGFMRNATNIFNDKINRYVRKNQKHGSVAEGPHEVRA